MIVVPVVGILSDAKAFSPSPCADEVEAIFDAPLEMFLKVYLLFYIHFFFVPWVHYWLQKRNLVTLP